MKRSRKKKPAKRPEGRPPKFRAEFCERAYRVCLSGATDEELAKSLGVHEATINRWKAKHPEFCEALKAGKAAVNQRVEKTLLLRALGEWTQPAVKIFIDDGQPMVVPYTEHFPPDVGACLSWLKNRDPERWRDRTEITGKDGGPVRITQLSDAELERIAAGGH